MIQPRLQNETLLADIASAAEDGENFYLWWLGQSGFLLKWRRHSILLDPYLSESLTRKYAGTDKEHIRMTARCVAPEALGFVEAVTSSHAHTDHFDAATLLPLGRAHAAPLPIVLPTANLSLAAERLAEIGPALHGLDAGESVSLGEFTFTGIPAAHDTVERDENGKCRFLGFVVRFGGWTLYHSGDTRWHEALPSLLKACRPHVALLPINGHDPSRRVAGNLDGIEAASLAKAAGASLAIPHHFDMFTFNTATPDEFLAECARVGQRARVLHCGERWSSAELQS